MGQEQIVLAFNWQNFWKVWVVIGEIVGTIIWILITMMLLSVSLASLFNEYGDFKEQLAFLLNEYEDYKAALVFVPITIVWIGLSIAIYAGMH